MLGAWTTNDHYWLFAPSTGKLYSFGYAYSRGVRGTYCYRVVEQEIPADAQSARVSRKGRGECVCDGYRPYQVPEPEPMRPSVQVIIDPSPSSVRWALKACDGLENTGRIRVAIESGQCVIVSDGSFQSGFSTEAYIIVDEEDASCQLDV